MENDEILFERMAEAMWNTLPSDIVWAGVEEDIKKRFRIRAKKIVMILRQEGALIRAANLKGI